MKQMIRVMLVCTMAAWMVRETFAASAEPTLAKAGKLLFEDDFARSEMAPKWRVGKGSFEVKDGVVSAAEIPADKHGAYAYAKPAFEFKDIVTEFSVKLDGSRACNLMINDSKYKESHAGHILRATFMLGKVSVADYKFGAMKNDIFEKNKDPKTTPEEKKKLNDSIKDKQAVFKADEDLSQWHRCGSRSSATKCSSASTASPPAISNPPVSTIPLKMR
jgi:hypothetical protein